MSGIITITLGMLIILFRSELAKIYYYFESKTPVKSRRMYNVEYIPIFTGIILIIRGVVSFIEF
ncbi:MAG: hypothetical protein AB1521_01995 [Bacteroidota bacterium]